jgi:hypothetical protein
MNEKYFIVHTLKHGQWHYIKSYRRKWKYYKVTDDEVINNQEIYNVEDYE